MKYKKVYLHAVTFFLTVLIFVGLSLIVYRTQTTFKKPDLIKKDTSLKASVPPFPMELDLPEREKVKPSRPQDLDINVYYEDNKPKTQEEWNAFIFEAYRRNREEFEENYTGGFGPGPYEQLDNADLKEIETNRSRLEEEISECEEKLKTYPDDEDLQKRLENWQKIKALLVAVYGEKADDEQ